MIKKNKIKKIKENKNFDNRRFFKDFLILKNKNFLK